MESQPKTYAKVLDRNLTREREVNLPWFGWRGMGDYQASLLTRQVQKSSVIFNRCQSMINDELYRQDHFQYRGLFYPLEGITTNTFEVEVHTTFEFRKTLVVTAKSDAKIVREQSPDLRGLSGFVAFDLETPFNWDRLTGHQREEQLTSDSDVSICTEEFHFAEQESLEILERDGSKYKMKLAWNIGNEVATALGWFGFDRIVIHFDDKIFGAQRRTLMEKFGDSIPQDLTEKLNSEIIQNTWDLLCDIAPEARRQFAEPALMPGNYCVFRLKEVP